MLCHIYNGGTHKYAYLLGRDMEHFQIPCNQRRIFRNPRLVVVIEYHELFPTENNAKVDNTIPLFVRLSSYRTSKLFALP
jgi:uncharacterized protein YcgL (UPF0745 family)